MILPIARRSAASSVTATTGFILMHTISPDEAMPLDRQKVVDGLRGATEICVGEAGLIEADAKRTASGIPFIYSLVKSSGSPAESITTSHSI